MHGNTSINPFFYGTFLGETKPGEPVTRTKKQAFQADAVGVAHQLTPAHFNRTHTFRLEWQPGPGGRIDWFSKGHRINSTFSMEGDGLGKDWVHAYGLRDESISSLMGSMIPIEPMYLIMNTAVSSTWGFPFDTPDWCEKCYDCDDPKCACTFAPGFCNMLKDMDVSMQIDSIRVYQSRDPSAHVGENHTLGCDPPDYPTKEWIKGHSYRYMRNPPFSYDDKDPIRKVQKGGGRCTSDADCGADVHHVNLTAKYESGGEESASEGTGRGKCVDASAMEAMFSMGSFKGKVCKCNSGFTGPHCLAQAHTDDTISAYRNKMQRGVFRRIPHFQLTPFMILIIIVLVLQMVAILVLAVANKKRGIGNSTEDVGQGVRRSEFKATLESKDLIITGRSV